MTAALTPNKILIATSTRDFRAIYAIAFLVSVACHVAFISALFAIYSEKSDSPSTIASVTVKLHRAPAPVVDPDQSVVSEVETPANVAERFVETPESIAAEVDATDTEPFEETLVSTPSVQSAGKNLANLTSIEALSQFASTSGSSGSSTNWTREQGTRLLRDRYLESWTQSYDRVGRVNFPADAQRDRLSGTVTLKVALNEDGSIQEVLALGGDANSVLAQAAVKIAHLAAPYNRVPVNLLNSNRLFRFDRTVEFRTGGY